MYTWLALNAPSDIDKLVDHIPVEYAPAQVAKRLAEHVSAAVKFLLVEHNYTDKDYRSTYYHFYAKKGLLYRPDCVRLHFFDELMSFDKVNLTLACTSGDHRLEDHYFGYMVLRPTGVATIGRSIMSPDIRNGATGFIIAAKHKVHLLGYRFSIEGFPSMDQHSDISVCAHAACWAILRHYSERYNIYREYQVHDITLMAQQFDPGGLVPSRGLDVSHAERVFQEAGTFPVHVARRNIGELKDCSFYRQLLAYVESGFPLFAAMHALRHAVTVVGFQWSSLPKAGAELRYSWDEVDSLVVVDDNHLPYLSIPTSGGLNYSAMDIDGFIVALPEKIFYPADAVDRLASALFALNAIIELPKKQETIVRYFITTGSALRTFMRNHESEFDNNLLSAVMTLPLAQFVWIIEYATQDQWSRGQISARAVVDATASLMEDMPLWLFHSRKNALVFDRRKVGSATDGLRALELAGMESSSLSRMTQNLRPIKP